MVLAKLELPEFPPMPRLRNARQGFFHLHEFDRFSEHLSPFTRGIFTFTYLTGWRISEGCSREWRHVDFDEGFIRLEREAAKEKSDRVFPFAVLPELQACLKEQLELAERLSRKLGIAIPWVFFTERGTRFNSRSGPNSALRKAWTRGLAAAGLGPRLIHDFRRSACRNLVQAGVPESEAMKLTGHKTDRVFRDYNISTFEDRKVSVAKVAEYMARLRAEAKRGASEKEQQRPAETSGEPSTSIDSSATRHAGFGVLTIPVSRPIGKNGDTTVTLEDFLASRGEGGSHGEDLEKLEFGEVAERSKAHASKACVPIGYRGFESHPLRSMRTRGSFYLMDGSFIVRRRRGEVPERSKGRAWRARVPKRYRGFESHPLRVHEVERSKPVSDS
jgi:Phage integrase family